MAKDDVCLRCRKVAYVLHLCPGCAGSVCPACQPAGPLTLCALCKTGAVTSKTTAPVPAKLKRSVADAVQFWNNLT